MANLEKKKAKLQERINELETELRVSLTKKTSDTKEIDVAGTQRIIQLLRETLRSMK